jgi:hypothetical protein
MHFRFLDLPPEIRVKIYLNLCTSSDYVPLAEDPRSAFKEEQSDPLNLFPLPLLLTCQQTYHEVRPLYFTHNAFQLRLNRLYLQSISYFLSPSFMDNRRCISTLLLIILRWGKKDSFLSIIAPILSDMILNGRLRNLEVRVKKDHLLGLEGELSESKDLQAVKLCVRPMAALRKICEDPYLENVRLYTFVKEGGFGSGEGMGEEFEGLVDVTHFLNRLSRPRR